MSGETEKPKSEYEELRHEVGSALFSLNENFQKIAEQLESIRKVTVKNGTEKTISISKAIAELWEATQVKRDVKLIEKIFNRYPLIKKLSYTFFIFLLSGILTTSIKVIYSQAELKEMIIHKSYIDSAQNSTLNELRGDFRQYILND